MPGYHRVDADTLHRASAGLFDSPCRCGRYGCPPCFNRHRILAHRMVQSIIRRQVDCAYALLATVEEWPRVQPVIRDHGAKYLRMRWTEGFFNTLVTAPVPGCGGPMDKLMAAVVAYETIRTAPRGHMPFLWHNQDFMEADQGPYGPQLVQRCDGDIMDWIMREVLPRAKKFRERVAASDGLPEMFIMAGGRYDG